MSALRTGGGWFLDETGRRVLLRGVNLGGSSKLPFSPDGSSHLPDSLDGDRQVSFIGRPFPLDEADEHLGRLRQWGFNVLRLLTTWEAIEHAGPGVYDAAYLDWFAELTRRAGEHGFFVFIDAHQDVWGRWSGGDGAPRWTYTAVGLDPDTFDAVDAAITMQRRYPDQYGQMVWPVNYSRFAAATMFTLFFGGDDFAPQVRIGGEGVQSYLQRHFIAALGQVAARLRDMPHVLGYGPLNEPSRGYIGKALDQPDGAPFPGPRPTPYDGMLAAAGFARSVPVYGHVALAQVPTGSKVLNPEGHSAWLHEAPDIWREAGVWELERGTPQLLRPDYFLQIGERSVDFNNGYLKPFISRFAEAIRGIHPGTLMFVESEPFRDEGLLWTPDDPPDVVNATHWYDAITLFTKHFNGSVSIDVFAKQPVLGAKNIRQMFARQIASIKEQSEQQMGSCPTLIGEFGLPYDLNNGAAFKTGDFRLHTRLLDRYYSALDASLVSSTQWNYTSDNTNQWGDRWNHEDLSIFSHDQQSDPDDPNSGGRGIDGFCRPFARRTAGVPQAMSFNRRRGVFELHYDCDPTITEPTEIYVPRVQYPHGYEVELSSGEYEGDLERQLLLVRGAAAGAQSVVLRRSRTKRV